MPLSYIWNPDQDLYKSITSTQPSKGNFYSYQEAEFQLSFLIPVYKQPFGFLGNLNAAYTHHSWWQVYNSKWSKPFRETNYTPELFYRKIVGSKKTFLGLAPIAYDIGYVHESNGQIQSLSRSWDRVFFRTLFTSSSVSCIVSLWGRLPENPNDDDNRDIVSFKGFGDLEVKKVLTNVTFEVKIPFARKPGVDLSVSFPWEEHYRLFISGRTGYGHSMIEYDRDSSRLGIGITLDSFLNVNSN